MERVGSYHLLRELAEAGTGRLHLARRVDEDEGSEPVVVKVLHDRFRKNAFYTATLFSEAPAARRFRHPVALGVFDIDDVDGKLFVAMEQATGPSWRTLRDRARAAGRMFSSDSLLWLGRQIAVMLEAARAEPWSEGEVDGLIVGQLAPQGIFLNRAGEVRVSGVGLGRSRSCLPPTRGRLPYRAPELFGREPVRPATDLYALGMVLYDALAGSESFQRESVAEVKAAVLEEPLSPLEHVPEAIDELIRALAAKDPDDRPKDLAAVGKTLGSALSRDGSLIAAEWAEHVRVLCPELFEPEPMPAPRRPPRVSVPYSQTNPQARRTPPRGTASPGSPRPRPTPPGERALEDRGRSPSPPFGHPAPAAGSRAPPDGGRAPSGPAVTPRPVPFPDAIGRPPLNPASFGAQGPASAPSGPPPVPAGGSGPSTFDIDDLAEILATGSLGPGRSSRSGAASASAAAASSRGAPTVQRATSSLAALEDEDAGFDVDSLVDAIVAGSGSRARTDQASSPPSPPPAFGAASTSEDLDPNLIDWSGDLPPSSGPSPFDSGSGDPIPAPRSIPNSETEPPLDEPSEERTEPVAPGARPPGPGRPPPVTPWGGTFSPFEPPRGDPDVRRGGVEPPTLPPIDEESTEPQFASGSVIQDRYRIIEELGRGGMSIVYRAEHTLLLKEVALKLLRPELSVLGNVVERFQREARSVCRLDDPNIVRVTDFGRTESGLLYLVMDLIQGESLASAIKQGGPMPLRKAITLVDQILAGLEHAHKFEVVHRDLKPENIMLVPREGVPQVKILDFGIAKLGGGDSEQKSITQAGTVFGTPRYMSPEQAAGEPVDHRTDLYTVGVILYQLLTGRVPFLGETTVQLLAKVLTQDPPPMEFEAPHEGARLQIEALTMKALAKEPEDRFESARAFREALDGCLLF